MTLRPVWRYIARAVLSMAFGNGVFLMQQPFIFIENRHASVRADVLSGLTVALALVPEAVAFAFVAGVPPIVGLYGAFMMGLATSIFGGRPGMISGATGATAVVMATLVSQGNALGATGGSSAGLQCLFATLILAGTLQLAAGLLRLGKFVRMIPSPAMMGFVNGLAIVIFLSQLGMFKQHGHWLGGTRLQGMLALTALAMLIMVLLPKVTKNIPAALTAIAVVSAIVIAGRFDTATVASFIIERGGKGIAAGLPTFAVPMIPLNWNSPKPAEARIASAWRRAAPTSSTASLAAWAAAQ